MFGWYARARVDREHRQRHGERDGRPRRGERRAAGRVVDPAQTSNPRRSVRERVVFRREATLDVARVRPVREKSPRPLVVLVVLVRFVVDDVRVPEIFSRRERRRVVPAKTVFRVLSFPPSVQLGHVRELHDRRALFRVVLGRGRLDVAVHLFSCRGFGARLRAPRGASRRAGDALVAEGQSKKNGSAEDYRHVEGVERDERGGLAGGYDAVEYGRVRDEKRDGVRETVSQVRESFDGDDVVGTARARVRILASDDAPTAGEAHEDGERLAEVGDEEARADGFAQRQSEIRGVGFQEGRRLGEDVRARRRRARGWSRRQRPRRARDARRCVRPRGRSNYPRRWRWRRRGSSTRAPGSGVSARGGPPRRNCPSNSRTGGSRCRRARTGGCS